MVAGRRVFTNAELAALGSALRDLYTGVDPQTIRPEETPRLEQLCSRLKLKGDYGRALADEIASRAAENTPHLAGEVGHA